jgi:hypothetical protein
MYREGNGLAGADHQSVDSDQRKSTGITGKDLDIGEDPVVEYTPNLIV